MSDMTFEDLLALSPLEDETKKEFRDKYPTFSSEQQMEVLHILWRSYRIVKRFYKKQLKDEYGEKMVLGTFTPPADYEAFINKEVESMMNKKKLEHIEGQELQDIRSKLSTYINSSEN